MCPHDALFSVLLSRLSTDVGTNGVNVTVVSLGVSNGVLLQVSDERLEVSCPHWQARVCILIAKTIECRIYTKI